MVDEMDSGNQRPVVIGAIILAALMAAALWYFLVFRPNRTSTEIVTETMSPTPSEVPAGDTAQVGNVDPSTVPTTALTTPVTPVTHIEPTAPTGPAETTAVAAVLAMMAGLRGAWRRWSRAPQA
jgi:hypothetical protein